jgi:SHS2 domain-containing protein
MGPERFEIVEHTADIGIRAGGHDLAELFTNAAAGMFTIMADPEALETNKAATVSVRVSTTAASLDELLVVWLEELLFISESHELLLRQVEVEAVGDGRAGGVAFGIPFSHARDALRGEIKAVTYHLLEVKEDPTEGWTCQVIFDV